MQVIGLPCHVIRNGRAASRLLATKIPNIEATRRDPGLVQIDTLFVNIKPDKPETAPIARIVQLDPSSALPQAVLVVRKERQKRNAELRPKSNRT